MSSAVHVHYLCLLVLTIHLSIAAAKVPIFQRVCRIESVSGNPGDQIVLDYNERTATVDVTLLDKRPSVSHYAIHLTAKWNNKFDRLLPNDESVLCQDHYLLPHTDEVIRLQQKGVRTIRLPYIYTGFYRLSVVPWIDNATSSNAMGVAFIARSIPNPVAIHHWTTQFIIHPLPSFSSIIVQFIPATGEYGFYRYEVLLSVCDSASLTVDRLVPTCNTNQSKPECTFDNLTPGKYCAFVRPLDKRCNGGNVWQVDDHCIVHSDVTELLPPPSASPTNTDWFYRQSILNAENHSAVVLAAVIIGLLLSMAAFTTFLVYRMLKKRRTSWTSGKFSSFRSISIRSTSSQAQKNIFVLWFPDDLRMIQQVNHLKAQLLNHCNARIVDIYDDSLYDEILIDPFAWLNETMAIQDLRVLIIDSPQLKLSSLVKDEELECLQHSNGLEGIVRYAIRQLWLRQASNHSLYSSTFFVGFSSQPSFHDESANLHLTPLRHFLLPAHLSELFMYINS